MKEYYEVREKTKNLLKKMRVLDFIATIYHSRWMVRRVKNDFGARKRKKGYLDPKFTELKKFENIHSGERCFIICTGPSLTLEDVNRLKDEYTFSMNSITKIFSQTDWRPTYYVIEDIDVYIALEKELNLYRPIPFFISDWLNEKVKPEMDTVSYPFDMLNHYSVGYHRPPKFLFSDNAYAMVYNGYTITFIAMQLAVYMGFKEIYLIGCDCDYSGEKKHFVDFKSDADSCPIIDTEQKLLLSYEVAKEYADTHGIKIYNATRGGKLEVFERVDFDKLMK